MDEEEQWVGGKDVAQSIPPYKIIGGGVKIIDTGVCRMTKGKKRSWISMEIFPLFVTFQIVNSSA